MWQEFSSWEMGLLGASMLVTMGHDAVRETIATRAEKQLDFGANDHLEEFAAHIDTTEHFDWAAEMLVNCDGVAEHCKLAENFSDDYAC